MSKSEITRRDMLRNSGIALATGGAKVLFNVFSRGVPIKSYRALMFRSGAARQTI